MDYIPVKANILPSITYIIFKRKIFPIIFIDFSVKNKYAIGYYGERMLCY